MVRPSRPRPCASGQVMTMASASAAPHSVAARSARAAMVSRTSLHVECGTFYRQSAAPARRVPLALPFALLCTAVAAWLSQGDDGIHRRGRARIALLPVSISACADRGGGAPESYGSRGGRRITRAAVAAWLAGVLPWLSGSVPAAFLIWSGPLALLVWVAVGLSLASSALSTLRARADIALARVDCGASGAIGGRAARVHHLRVSAWQVRRRCRAETSRTT